MNRPIIIAICLFIALTITVVLVLPKYQNLKSLEEKFLEKKTELQYQQEYFLNLNKLSEEIKKYSETLSKIDSALPSDASLPALFNFLQKASSESGLVLNRLGDVTSAALETQKRLKEHRLDLSVSGSYSSFKSFLSTLEKTARLIEVESIYFARGEESIPFSIKIKFYSY